jgi:hypothetical protein
MKNYYRLLVLCLLCAKLTVATAQQYFSMPTSTRAQWRIENVSGGMIPPHIGYTEYRLLGDSTVNGRVYHHISDGSLYRELNHKIYAINPSGSYILGANLGGATTDEYLAFDFDAPNFTLRNGGDTLRLQYITPTQYGNTTRNKYTMQGSCWYEEWVQGIGVVNSGCFEYNDDCVTMISDSGYVFNDGHPLQTQNTMGCQASFSVTRLSPNFFSVHNTSPSGYQHTTWWSSLDCPPVNGSSIAVGVWDSIIVDLRYAHCFNPQNPPTTSTLPNAAVVVLQLWNDAANCYSLFRDTIYADHSCHPDFTINRLSPDSFLVRNVSASYTQARWIAPLYGPTGAYLLTPLPNNECLAVRPANYSTLINHYTGDVILEIVNDNCLNSKGRDLPHAIYCTNNCFFAGDANRDGTADNMDLLPIALNYGATGLPRSPDFATDWVAHAPKTWATITPNSTINASFSDCNGDGEVAAIDTIIVLRNYGFHHNDSTGVWRPAAHNTTIAPPVSCTFATDTLRNLTFPYRLTAAINVGSAALPVPNLYGVAFTVHYTAALAEKASIDYNALAWLGAPNELLYLQKDDGAGNIDIAIARKDHQPRTGFGQLASANFYINDNRQNGGTLTNGNATFEATISRLKAIDQNGIDILLNPSTHSVVLQDIVLGTTAFAPSNAIQIAPNPTYDRQLQYALSGNLQCQKIQVLTAFGQTILETVTTTNTDMLTIPATANAGIYALVFYTNQGIFVKKVMVF